MQASYQKYNLNMSILKWAKQSYCYTKKKRDIQNAGTGIMGKDSHIHISFRGFCEVPPFSSCLMQGM